MTSCEATGPPGIDWVAPWIVGDLPRLVEVLHDALGDQDDRADERERQQDPDA